MKEARYLRELETCVKCGSCKALCPTYDVDKTEGMGARGRLRLLWHLSNGDLKPTPLLNKRIFSCTLCGMCNTQCPPGVDIRETIFHGRALIAPYDRKRLLRRLSARLLFKNPLAGVAEKILSINVKTALKNGLRVSLFSGCSMRFLEPSLRRSLIRALEDAGCSVVLPRGEVCCGLPLRALGLEEDAAGLAERNLAAFDKLNTDVVISPCPTCTFEIAEGYKKLTGSSIANAVDLTFFLNGKVGFLKKSASGFEKVIYHEPCHQSYGLGIKEEPKDIIKSMGIEPLEPDERGCCGYGARMADRKMSDALLDKLLYSYRKTGADAIVTTCPGCIRQLRRGPLKVMHLLELMDWKFSHFFLNTSNPFR